MVKVRDGQVANRPFYAAIGVTVDGRKDVLGLWAGTPGQGEGAKYWLAVLTELKNRGVADTMFVVCDGLKGLPEVVETTWPDAIVQTCVIQVLTELVAGFLLVSGLLDSVRPRDLGRGMPAGPGRVGRAEGGLGRRWRRGVGAVAAA